MRGRKASVERLMAQWEAAQAKADGLKRKIEATILRQAAAEAARPAPAARARRRRGPGRPRGKRTGPTVRELIGQVLKASKEPLTPAEITRRIVAKHPKRDSETFYNQVFTNLARADEFRRLANGSFQLRGAKGPKKAKATKKTGKKGTAKRKAKKKATRKTKK